MYKKLLEVQKKIGAISKDSTNPFFKSKYFDINKLLDVVKPILNEQGLILMQPLTNIDGNPAICTTIIDAETSKNLEFVMPITANPDPQKMGSAITYYRRYSLQSLLGLQAEDDDGNKASKPTNNEPQRKKATAKKFIPETSKNVARDRINKGFEFMKFNKDKQQDWIENYLPAGMLDANIEELNSLLKALEKQAKETKWVKKYL